MSKKYLCLECGEIYNSEQLNLNPFLEDILCPKSSCSGYLIEVDELLIPTIKLLNDKGYITNYCCSGHYSNHSPRCYILFAEGIDIPNTPKRFKKVKLGDCLSLESLYSSKGKSYRDFYEICDNAKTLLKWAISLPDNNI
ncbi:MAG: hypothetical protein IJA10_10530 [Lachnospiraceae bacterium]|nr:hypothetical protein [Lachnospiraceae bacterium]